jgi:hypothetical protein
MELVYVVLRLFIIFSFCVGICGSCAYVGDDYVFKLGRKMNELIQLKSNANIETEISNKNKDECQEDNNINYEVTHNSLSTIFEIVCGGNFESGMYVGGLKMSLDKTTVIFTTLAFVLTSAVSLVNNIFDSVNTQECW